MKFSCERDFLMESINVTQKAVSTKSTLPALEGILLQTVGTCQLKITGYDLEIGIECKLEAEIEEKGSIILNSKMFGEIIRKMPSAMVTISVDEKLITTITCGRSEFNIVGLDSNDFPELPKIEGENNFILPQAKLKSMIKQTLFAVSTNDNKPVHTGTMFEILNGDLRLIAVDGFRLAMRKEKVTCSENMSFVVPGKTLSEILKILKDDEESSISIVLTKKHIVFEIENITVVSRLLEGDFLNYNNAIPKNAKIFTTIEVKPFANCVDRASLLISEKMKSPVKIQISDKLLKINCMSTLGKIHDEMDVISEGGEIEIGFNNKYLLDALKACEQEKIRMELSSPLSPCVMVPIEGDSFLFLVLPVRLKSNEA